MSLPDVVLTNLDKVLWPRAGFRKGDMIEYYRRIAPALLPHLTGRPLVTHRSPDGVEGKGWFQTRCPHPPAWLRTATVPSGSRRGEAYEYCVVDDLRSLLWVANLGALLLCLTGTTTRLFRGLTNRRNPTRVTNVRCASERDPSSVGFQSRSPRST